MIHLCLCPAFSLHLLNKALINLFKWHFKNTLSRHYSYTFPWAGCPRKVYHISAIMAGAFMMLAFSIFLSPRIIFFPKPIRRAMAMLIWPAPVTSITSFFFFSLPFYFPLWPPKTSKSMPSKRVSMSATSSGVRVISPAPRFSRRRSALRLPGIGMM